MNPPFVKGVTLSHRLYWEAVRPILDAHFPGLGHSAALIGSGSDVLGFDTVQSTDHDWGPRMQLFLAEDEHASVRDAIDELLRRELPPQISGFSTHFGRHGDGTTVMAAAGGGPIDHRVEVCTIRAYFGRALGCDPYAGMGPVDWLLVPENVLRMLTAGAVHHDGLGALEPLRQKLAYYPRDIWRYRLAAQWSRIGQEEAFPGRCAQVGDELGSRLVAARLVRDVMSLAFLMERTYAPYAKWFGTAFTGLACAGELSPSLEGVLAACAWEDREHELCDAYQTLARMHNRLGITPPLETRVSPFHERPFSVIHADRFVDAIRTTIEDPQVLALPEYLGSVDQFVDLADALHDLSGLRGVYAQ